MKKSLIVKLLIVAIVAYGAFAYFNSHKESETNYDTNLYASGNGRLEATEVSINVKFTERIEKLLVNEGDTVTKGQAVAKLKSDTMQAEYDEAVKSAESAVHDVEVKSQAINVARCDVASRQADLTASKSRFIRSRELVKSGAISKQTFDDDEARYKEARSALASAKENVRLSVATLASARANAEATKAHAEVLATKLQEETLYAPRSGRIQYRVAREGEVVDAGGRVFSMWDMDDVYMTFYVSEFAAGRIKIGADVLLVMDSDRDHPIPAKVSYVATVAQFTPKTVETKDERSKLMFRIKAKVDPSIIANNPELKAGVPGVAWVKFDADKPWPKFLKAENAKH